MAPPAAPRATRLTGRAAVLAVVICAIALSLAYPIREYVNQRRQIDALVAQQQSMLTQVKSLQAHGIARRPESVMSLQGSTSQTELLVKDKSLRL